MSTSGKTTEDSTHTPREHPTIHRHTNNTTPTRTPNPTDRRQLRMPAATDNVNEDTMHTPPHATNITPTPTPTTNTNGYATLPLPTLRTTDIRLLSHNINTLHTSSEAELGATCDLYQAFDPTVIGLQECNKNWTSYDKTERPLRDTITRRWTGAKLVTAHCKETLFKGPYQPGGVAQMVLCKVTGRVTASGRDTLGRYAWQDLLLDGTRTLRIITAYRVTQSSLTGCGQETSAMQQWRRLREHGIELPNPRQQILDDLSTFISPYVAAGHEVIIMIDANSTTDDTNIETFMATLNLYDLMNDYLPDHHPSTYQRGNRKIDHIWGTIGVLTAMTGAGILPFGEGPRSDHPILYADISLATLCGMSSQSIHDPTHPASRNLWSTDIKASAAYVNAVQHGFAAENINDRIAILIDRCNRTAKCTANDIQILNKIDKDITSILLAAEGSCKKAKGHAWSPLLANAGRTVIAAKWHLSDLLNGRHPITLWDRAEAIIQAKLQVKAAYGVLRQVQQDAKRIRDTFLEDRAEHLADTRQIAKATAIRQLLRAERQTTTFKRLRIWFKGDTHVNLDRILVPDDPNDTLNTTWTAIVEQQALFEVLTAAGQAHFKQASDTPFVTGPIASKLGPFADNQYCDAILNGTFDFTDLETITEVKDIVKGMRYPDPANPTPQINTTITTEAFSNAVQHMRERTSSSPSGRHYGHYRALLRDPTILGNIAALANFCFKWGCTLKRWEKVTQPMIPKDAGTPKITRIRRITLLEADLNICLSELFGNRLMQNAEKHQILHRAQYGSRKGKMAISAVLLKRLSYDIIRQARMDACMFDNDASACYDRVIPSIAMIKCRRAGMSREATQVLLVLLRNMKYYVRTAYGISEEAFSNLIDWILGIMQGGGHSCGIWALTSSVMLDQMDSTPGATFHSPQPSISMKRTGEAFVDDTSLWLLKLGIALAAAVQMMQRTAQRWERLLYSTGGALNHSKCFWYGIEWSFTPTGEPKMRTEVDDVNTIQLTAGTTSQQPTVIQRISTSQGQRTLGVRLAPDGNDRDEVAYRTKQAKTMAQRIKTAPLGREYIGIGFRAIWQMMIQYPLGATCFTVKQCRSIQAKYLPTFLSKMGINRTTATAVRHGPTLYGGMEVKQLDTEQGVQQTSMVVAHLRKKDDVAQMLHISLDHLQLQAGVSWPVLSRPGHMQRLYVDHCYVSNTWEFLDSIDGHIQMEREQWIYPQRHFDSFIMEELSSLPNIKPIELVHAQRCRLFLGVTTVADISSSNGSTLCGWALNGQANPRPPIFRYPRQERPSPTVWATWRKVLQMRYSVTQAGKLDQPLGRWHKGRISQVWDTVLDPATALIYMWIDHRVRIYERRGRSQKQYRYRQPHTSNSFPRGCIPVTGEIQQGNFIISGFAIITSPPTSPPTISTDHTIMNRGVQTNTPLHIVAQAIWDGQAIMGTDGSVTGEVATYSWVISTTTDDINADVTGGGFLPPTATYLEPYSKRPEAAALLSGLTWIKDLLQTYPDTTMDAGPTPTLPIPVDNEAVIKDLLRPVNELTSTFQLLNPDYDIIQAIRTILESLPIKTDIFHVKSHQDKQHHFDDLPSDAQINILADHHATAIYQIPPHHTGLFPTWIPGTCAALFHRQHQVTKTIPDYIRTAKHAPDMKAYLIRRSHEATGRDSTWDEQTFDTIAWQPLGESFKALSAGQRIQLSKYMNDLLPTLKRQQTFDNKMDGRCFDCGQLWEDTNHVLRCPSDSRCNARDAAFTSFRQHLLKQHTPDVMANLLCDSMKSWIDRTRITPPTWTPPIEPIMTTLTKAFESQRHIGWDQFFRGRIAKDWKIAIHTYYRERQPGESFTPDQWMRTTIAAIWKFAMTLWRQRNAAYHGENSANTLETKRQEAATKATTVYQATIGNILPSDSLILHRAKITEILTWTKQHLDAYLATAEVICEWNVEPG